MTGGSSTASARTCSRSRATRRSRGSGGTSRPTRGSAAGRAARWCPARICAHVLAFEGDSQVTWFEGNFEAYEEQRRERLGAEADRPHRISYTKLTRAQGL